MSVAVVTRSEATSNRLAHALGPLTRRVLFVDHHAACRPGEADLRVEVVLLELTGDDDTELMALCELVGEPVAVVAVVSGFRPDLATSALELGALACVLPDARGPGLATAIEGAAIERERQMVASEASDGRRHGCAPDPGRV